MSSLGKDESSLENEDPNIIFKIIFVMVNMFLWGHLFSCTLILLQQETLSVYSVYADHKIQPTGTTI